MSKQLLWFLIFALTSMLLISPYNSEAQVAYPQNNHSNILPQSKNIESLKKVFDKLDKRVNEGKGYQDYLNPDGFPTGALLAWSQSYLMQGYAEMFRATGDEYYLDKLFEHVKAVMRNRDDFRGQHNWKGDLVPDWGTDRYRKVGDWKHLVVIAGMITYPMLDFVRLVREYRIERLEEEAEEILSRVKETVDYHNAQWVVQESGFGLYTYDEGYYGISNYVCPLSQQATIGRSLLLLWSLTGKEEYLRKVTDIAIAIDRSLEESGKDSYIWGVNFGHVSDSNPVADISHSTITINFIDMVYKEGIAFTSCDISKITTTIKGIFKNGRVTDRIDGTGGCNYEIAAGQYAFLAQYDPKIWGLCYNILFELYRVDLTGKYFQEDWWGTVMLGIARLANNAIPIENWGK